MEAKSFMRIVLATAFLLLIPLVAMQFTHEVVWRPFDFVVAGVLLAGTGLTYELVSRRGPNAAYRVAVGIAVVAGLLLIWINLAVGIIGDEDNPANLLYAGVLAIGVLGAVLARFKPGGMARALFAAAIAQALVPVVALMIWNPSVKPWGSPGVVGVFILNAFFVLLFVVAALLFRRSAGDRSREADRGMQRLV